jgi:DNA-binding CsgD family transcriptional regulator
MLAQEILTKFYAEQLPIWNHLIEEGIKREIATWTLDPTENAERLVFYWPLWAQFFSSFSKKPLDDNPRMLKALTCMDPHACAVDAAYKLNQGKTFDSIIQGHVDAVGALWKALNILGYALEAAEGEFAGKQTIRMALQFRDGRIDLRGIVNKVCKKAGYPKLSDAKSASHIESEIVSVVNLTLAELMNQSAKKTPLTDNWETPPGRLGDKIREILTRFDPATGQAQDAVMGLHENVPIKARDKFLQQKRPEMRQALSGTGYIATLEGLIEKHPILKNKITLSVDAFAKNNRILVNFNEDPIEYPLKFVELGQIEEFGSKEDKTRIQISFNEQSDALCEDDRDKLIIDIARAKKKLTRKQRHIIEYIASNPDAKDTEIAQAFQITRKTVYNCKQKMRDLLTHPTK